MILQESLFLNSLPYSQEPLQKLKRQSACAFMLASRMAYHGTPDTIMQHGLLSCKVTGMCILMLQKRNIICQKWFDHTLAAQKAFRLSAHKLFFFLLYRHELGTWLNCSTFIIFFFLGSTGPN